MTSLSYAGIYKIGTTVQEMIAKQFKFPLELNKIDIENGKLSGDLGSEIPVSPVEKREKRKGKGKMEEEKGKEKEEDKMECHEEFFWLSNNVSKNNYNCSVNNLILASKIDIVIEVVLI